REANEAIRRADWDAVAAYYDPHIFIRTDPTWPEQRIYGRAAVLDFVRSGCELWGPDVRLEAIVDLGDRLLVRVHWNTRARSTLESRKSCASRKSRRTAKAASF